jgi:ferritin-like metal-binding protein YciE
MPTKTQSKKQEKQEEEHVLEDLLIIQLRGLYDVEVQLAKALPKLAKKGTNQALKDAIEQSRAQTENCAKRLEGAFEVLEVKAQKLPSAAVRGLIEDADWITKNILGAAAIDVGLVAALQAIQHYRLALYGAAFEWAKLLEIQGVVDILEEIVHDADEGLEILDELAGSKINEEALGEDGAEDDDEEEDESGELEEDDEEEAAED